MYTFLYGKMCQSAGCCTSQSQDANIAVCYFTTLKQVVEFILETFDGCTNRLQDIFDSCNEFFFLTNTDDCENCEANGCENCGDYLHRHRNGVNTFGCETCFEENVKCVCFYFDYHRAASDVNFVERVVEVIKCYHITHKTDHNYIIDFQDLNTIVDEKIIEYDLSC